MTYLLWSLPALTVIAAIASGRLSTTAAAILGLAAAIPVALSTAPRDAWRRRVGPCRARPLDRRHHHAHLKRPLFGTWPEPRPGRPRRRPRPATTKRRRLLFFACFLVGPFAESATGFGVGMRRPVDPAAEPVAPETMVRLAAEPDAIPWGAMGSGTLLASAYARVPEPELALHSHAGGLARWRQGCAVLAHRIARRSLRAHVGMRWRAAADGCQPGGAGRQPPPCLGPGDRAVATSAIGAAPADQPPWLARSGVSCRGAQRPPILMIAWLVATRLPSAEPRPVRAGRVQPAHLTCPPETFLHRVLAHRCRAHGVVPRRQPRCCRAVRAPLNHRPPRRIPAFCSR